MFWDRIIFYLVVCVRREEEASIERTGVKQKSVRVGVIDRIVFVMHRDVLG